MGQDEEFHRVPLVGVFQFASDQRQASAKPTAQRLFGHMAPLRARLTRAATDCRRSNVATRRASVTRRSSLPPGIPAGDVTAAAAPVSVGAAMMNPCAWRAVRRLSTWCCFKVRVLRSRRLPLRL